MEKEVENKINEFINERFIVSLLYSKYDEEFVELLILRKDVDKVILRLCNYLKGHINDLPESVVENGISILNQIYFKHRDKCISVIKEINEVKSLNNSKNQEDFNDYFLYQEYDRYIYQKNQFINRKSIMYLDIKDVINLNAHFFEFLYNTMYLSNEDFYIKYQLLDRYGLDTQYMYMINYMLNTCPEIFKIKNFRARIEAILKRNDHILTNGVFSGAQEVMPKIKYMKKYNKNILKKYEKR